MSKVPVTDAAAIAAFEKKLFVALTYVTRSEKTYHFAQKLKKRYKQKSRKKSFFNPKLLLAYLKFQLLGTYWRSLSI